jgi:hypothetical protein
MPESYPFDHFMSIYRNAYKAIDLRVALVYDNERWNVFGLHILIKVDSVERITSAYIQKVKGRKIYTDKLRIIQKSVTFTDYPQIASWLSLGRLKLEDFSLTFSPVPGIHSLTGQIDSVDHLRIPQSSSDWPSIRTSAALSTTNTFYQLIQRDLEIVRDIECAGFINLDDALKTMVEIENAHSQVVFLMHADIPIRIESIVADKRDTETIAFDMRARAHNMLAYFSINITTQKGSDTQYLGQVDLKKAEKNDDYQKWRGTFDISSSFEKDSLIGFALIHKDIGYIGRSSFYLYQLYKEEVRNPLLHALSYFCRLDDFRKMVYSAKGKPVTDLKSDKKYEVTIQWLLSVAGFQTIWLNKYEELKVDDHLYGTVDCLAYSEKENMLLFVNCTLGNPSEKELSSYREVYYYFADDVFKNSPLKLYSIVFSNAKSPATVHFVSRPNEVIVYYKNQVDELFEAVINGRESELVISILSPFFSTIRKS